MPSFAERRASSHTASQSSNQPVFQNSWGARVRVQGLWRRVREGFSHCEVEPLQGGRCLLVVVLDPTLENTPAPEVWSERRNPDVMVVLVLK